MQKEGIATAAGAGALKYTTDLTGNQTAGMLAGMAASMATGERTEMELKQERRNWRNRSLEMLETAEVQFARNNLKICVS